MSLDAELAAIADANLDQHFLVSEVKLATLVAAAGIRTTDHVVEVGAGAGTVARALPPAASLTVVELDERLGRYLRRNVPHARVVHGDAIQLVREIPCDVLIANLPHRVTEELIDVLPQLDFRTAVVAVGDLSILDSLAPALEWREVVAVTGRDFLPPQAAISRLVTVVRADDGVPARPGTAEACEEVELRRQRNRRG